MALVSLRHALVAAFVAPAVVMAACSSGGGSLTLADYDTSCTLASDCVAVVVNPTGCCDCPTGAINKADLAKYDAALGTRSQATCNVECGACPDVVAVCSHGTCGALSPLMGSVACGTTTCTGGEVCVTNYEEGSTSPPTYNCAPAPACPSGLSCACAQSLCQSSYACEGVSQGTVTCVLP
jgi:hypothetical protein